MISENDKLDLKTFSERQDKPFLLPDGLDAFSLFMPRISALTLEAFMHIFKLQAPGTGLAKQASIAEPIDPAYL